MIKKPEGKQHHGNLREALVLVGMQLLEEEGLEALTLRRCAALAGVSHAAPAHHFEGLRGLRTAIATRGYAIFEEMMQDGVDAAGADKKAQVVGMALGYVRFATEHTALFDLIFDRPEKFVPTEELACASARARKILNDMSAQFVAGPGGPSATEVTLFSLVHGFSKLIEIGRVLPGSGDGRDVKIEDVLAMVNLEAKSD